MPPHWPYCGTVPPVGGELVVGLGFDDVVVG